MIYEHPQVSTSKHYVLVRPTWQLMHLKHYRVESLACFKWYMLLSKLCIYAAPVMAVFLDGFEVFCVNILIGVFEQSALQSLLRVPRLRPRLQVFHNGFRYTFVMRSHNLGTVLPVHLGQNQKKLKCFRNLWERNWNFVIFKLAEIINKTISKLLMHLRKKDKAMMRSYLVAIVLFGVVRGRHHDTSTETQVGNCERLR